MKATSGARPNTSVVIKGGSRITDLIKINIVKDKGNTHFKLGEYEKAISAYTEALCMNGKERDVVAVLYSNRS